jgi:hypothetical protein
MQKIASSVLDQAMTYAQYRALLTELLAQGKTTGPDQSPSRLDAALLNQQRMNRIDKRFQLADEARPLLAAIDRPMLWLVLAEGWCGDGAQIVPALHGMAQANPSIELRVLLRDDYPDVIDAFLTDGARAIPKLIFVDPADGQVLGAWGPRPEPAAEIMRQYKKEAQTTADAATREALYEDAKLKLHTWYAHDRTVTTQLEVMRAALAAVIGEEAEV